MKSIYFFTENLGELPLLCICIPTYNAEKTIEESLASVLRQTYENTIVHIVDNASTDRTLKIVGKFADPRIRIHSHNVNIGAEGNFNRCIQIAEGKYTAIYHADDIYENEISAKQIAYLEANPKVGAVFTAARTIDAQGRSLGVIGGLYSDNGNEKNLTFQNLFKSILKRGNFLVCPSAMVRTEIYKYDIQNWRGELFRSSADLDVWLRIAKKYDIGFLNELLMRYRVDSNQFSNNVRSRTRKADFFLVIEYYLNFNLKGLGLTDIDLQNYRLLQINDKFWRAINYYIIGNNYKSLILLKNIFKIKNIFPLLTSKRDFLTLVSSCFLYFLIKFKFNYFGIMLINLVRRKLNK